MAAKPKGPTIKIKGKEYDVERDFTWRELLTVEELAGVPLGQAGALNSMGVCGAFFFVVLKREDQSLTWEGFLDGQVGEFTEEDKPVRPTRAAKPAAKKATA